MFTNHMIHSSQYLSQMAWKTSCLSLCNVFAFDKDLRAVPSDVVMTFNSNSSFGSARSRTYITLQGIAPCVLSEKVPG